MIKITKFLEIETKCQTNFFLLFLFVCLSVSFILAVFVVYVCVCACVHLFVYSRSVRYAQSKYHETLNCGKHVFVFKLSKISITLLRWQHRAQEYNSCVSADMMMYLTTVKTLIELIFYRSKKRKTNSKKTLDILFDVLFWLELSTGRNVRKLNCSLCRVINKFKTQNKFQVF